MFTGIVEETGEVFALERSAHGGRLTIRAIDILEGLRLGDSIAVNGCCLTLSGQNADQLSFDLLGETIDRTNLQHLLPGDPVNLERALAANGRLGGHFVQGHIDCFSKIVGLEQVGADHRLEIALPAEFSRYIAMKGSVAVDGISLTVAELTPASFVVWLIPHTLAVTNLRARQAGQFVNLEFDLLAKYLERLLPA
jgi:riboflavin synthase